MCINIYQDAVPPIHAESYHVATDKLPSKDGDKFRSIYYNEISGGHIGRVVVRRRCSAGPVLPVCVVFSFWL